MRFFYAFISFSFKNKTYIFAVQFKNIGIWI